MGQKYIEELRNDTSTIIIPVIAGATVFVAFLFVTIRMGNEFANTWHVWLLAAAAPLGSHWSWKLMKAGKHREGSFVFMATYLLLLTLVFVRNWEPGSFIPYVYIVFIVVAGMISHPSTGFYVWLASALLMIGGLFLQGQLTFINFVRLLGPLIIGFILAVAVFLSSVEWLFAIESVSSLHRRAQQRRDELFTTKEEVSSANKRLKFLNQQLEIARQAAVGERDLRTRFMNNVSHELRTPLNAIVNFAHILKLGGHGEINDAQRDYLSRIEQSGWHLLSVLNDLLDMAQIQSGEFKLHLEMTRLDTICEEAMANVRGLIMGKDKEIELIRDYPEKWPLVKIDKMRIKQALINLLGNSAKYTDEGHIALRVYVEGHLVYIVVEDTGIGIAPEHHESIFKEFRQVDESTARKRIGTGLGLPITRHLIERHNGTITVESDLGKGSKFIITLPVFSTKLLSVLPDEAAPSESAESSLANIPE